MVDKPFIRSFNLWLSTKILRHIQDVGAGYGAYLLSVEKIFFLCFLNLASIELVKNYKLI